MAGAEVIGGVGPRGEGNFPPRLVPFVPFQFLLFQQPTAAQVQ